MSDPFAEISRVPRTRHEAQAWYDRLSPWYDSVVSPFERTSRSIGIELLDAGDGERIADVGTGTGPALVPLAQTVGDDGRVAGIDIAEGMCREARKKAATSTVSNRIDVVMGDALSLPLRNGALDAVFTSFCLELFDTPDIPIVLDECKRVLRDDGRITVVSLSKRDAGLATSLYERIHSTIPRYVDCRPIFVERILRDEGFDIVETRTERMWGLSVEIVLATT